MINFDSLSLKAFVDEYGHIFESGRVQRIQQPTRREIILNVRSHRQNHKFYININPKYPHLCVLGKENEYLRDIEIPKQPPMFCMLLRKYLDGARIIQVRQPEHERILELYFESYNDLGEKSPLVLAIELMGKHSNIILYNCETQVILGCAHNVGEEKSKERELAGGLPYIYPPEKDKKNLLNTTFEEFLTDLKLITKPLEEILNQTYFDLSIPVARELIRGAGIDIKKGETQSLSKEQIKELYDLSRSAITLEILNPCMTKDVFSLFGLDKSIDWQEFDGVNDVLDLYFGGYIYEDKIERLKSSLRAIVNKEVKKISKTSSKLEKDLNKDEKAENYRVFADILTSNAHNITMPVDSVELENFYDENNKVIIELDRDISLNENIQKYYKLYSKTKKAIEMSGKMLAELNEHKNYLDGIKISIEQADKVNVLEEIRQELQTEGLIKKDNNKKPEKEKIQLDEYKMGDFTIYVGKNNKQNDYIVSKLARAEDLWLHTWEIPGSHVLIKVPPQSPEIPDDILLKAARLAVYFSQARDSAKVTVVSVRRRFLKKPPGGKLAYVTYTNEEAIIVDNTFNKAELFD